MKAAKRASVGFAVGAIAAKAADAGYMLTVDADGRAGHTNSESGTTIAGR